MTILQIITKSELGGAQSVVINLSNRLIEEHKVIVVAGEGDGKFFNELDSRIVKIHCRTLVRAISPLNEIKTILFFRKIYKQYHPDVVHLHSSKAGLLGRIVFPSSKIVYTVHGFDSIRLAFRRFLPLEKMLQYRSKAIVGVSQYDCQNLVSENINNNVTLVYNGIHDCSLPNVDMIKTLSVKYKDKVLCIARISPPKRVDLFMEVAKLMPDVAFVWIGNLDKVEKHPDNVFFWGNVPHSGYQCRFFDVFMLPSNYEGLPIVILEAMSCGLPIVASNVGGISEIVKDKVNGYTVDNDANLFAAKLSEILDNKELKGRMGKMSRQMYLEHFSDEVMASKYMKLYKQN